MPDTTSRVLPGDDVSWALEGDDFLGAALEGRPMLGGVPDGLCAMRMLDALYRLSLRGRRAAGRPRGVKRVVRALFLDRDGILNALVEREGWEVSPRLAEQFRILPEAAAAVARLRAAGFGIFVVANQPDLAGGWMAPGQLEQMHRMVSAELAPDAIAVCPHDDSDDCACRKPRLGMLLDLAARWSVDLAQSVVVGDAWRDVEAGRRAGRRTVLVQTAPDRAAPAVRPDEIVPTLDTAVARFEAWANTTSQGST